MASHAFYDTILIKENSDGVSEAVRRARKQASTSLGVERRTLAEVEGGTTGSLSLHSYGPSGDRNRDEAAALLVDSGTAEMDDEG
jgi:hypothetical protein